MLASILSADCHRSLPIDLVARAMVVLQVRLEQRKLRAGKGEVVAGWKCICSGD